MLTNIDLDLRGRFAACDQSSHLGFFPPRSVFLVDLGWV